MKLYIHVVMRSGWEWGFLLRKQTLSTYYAGAGRTGPWSGVEKDPYFTAGFKEKVWLWILKRENRSKNSLVNG